jgi:hypothetical protein
MTVRTPDLGTLASLLTGSGEEGDEDNSRATGVAMTCDEVSSLEVRWIFPGELQPAVARWFGRFPAKTEAREDTYLMNPRLRGLSVKIRGNGALEVKAYRGSQGILEVPGRARGHVQDWRKWSFPVNLSRPGRSDLACWRQVRKTRRLSRFVLASGEVVAYTAELRREPGCGVELTEICTQGRDWWSLGFEATGPGNLLRSELSTTAALVFAQPVPTVEPGTNDFASYVQWLACLLETPAADKVPVTPRPSRPALSCACRPGAIADRASGDPPSVRCGRTSRSSPPPHGGPVARLRARG